MDRKQIVERVSAISIAVNLILSAGKLAAGILAHTGAMVSDAVHSASYVFSTVIVIIGFRLSAKPADQEHRAAAAGAFYIQIILVHNKPFQKPNV